MLASIPGLHAGLIPRPPCWPHSQASLLTSSPDHHAGLIPRPPNHAGLIPRPPYSSVCKINPWVGRRGNTASRMPTSCSSSLMRSFSSCISPSCKPKRTTAYLRARMTLQFSDLQCYQAINSGQCGWLAMRCCLNL